MAPAFTWITVCMPFVADLLHARLPREMLLDRGYVDDRESRLMIMKRITPPPRCKKKRALERLSYFGEETSLERRPRTRMQKCNDMRGMFTVQYSTPRQLISGRYTIIVLGPWGNDQ